MSENGYAFFINEFTGEATAWDGSANLAHFGLDKHFQGLAIGPQNLDHDGDGFSGDLAQTFFAVTDNGRLYAINPFDEILRTDIFANGADHLVLFNPDDGAGLRRVTGLAFSNLDYNLWHPTAYEGEAPGHGILPSFDLSRDSMNERTFLVPTRVPTSSGA